MILPNNVGFPIIRVTESKNIAGADVLIGMDILCQGDFAITNKDKKTVMSYRFPSQDRIDYVARPTPPNQPYQKKKSLVDLRQPQGKKRHR